MMRKIGGMETGLNDMSMGLWLSLVEHCTFRQRNLLKSCRGPGFKSLQTHSLS